MSQPPAESQISRRRRRALIAGGVVCAAGAAVIILAVRRAPQHDSTVSAALTTPAAPAATVLAHVRECESAVRRQPDSYEGWLALAEAYLDAGQPDRAWQALPPPGPGAPPQALLLRGRIAGELGQGRAAENYLRAAQKALPDSARPGVELTKLLYEAGRLDEAQETASQNARSHPDDYDALTSAAKVAIYRSVPLPKTRTYLARAQRLNPSRPEAYALSALLQIGRPTEALPLAQEALALDPDNVDALRVVGWLKSQEPATAENVAQAEKCLQRAAALCPGEKLYCVQLGVLYRRANRLQEAERWLTRAAELDPKDGGIQHALAAVYAQQGRSEDAARTRALARTLSDEQARLRTLEERVLEDAADADAWAQLAALNLERGEVGLATERASRALSLAPHHADASRVLKGAMEATGG